jgi:para-nitrobenzyl esterase
VSFNRDGVVTVSISYRLGFDGFGWIADAPSNRGLLDQIAALEWVRENIEEFGGDPARVTVAGQSAGGGSVLALLAMPRAQPLFATAISQSGAAGHRTLEEAREVGTKFAAHMGVAPTRRGWASLSEDEILDGAADLSPVPDADVDSVDAAVAVARSVVVGGAGAGLIFAPHLDDELAAERPLESLAGGSGATKPLLLGTTAHEFTDAVAASQTALARHDPGTLLTAAGIHPAAAAALRRRFDHFDNAHLLGQVMTEYMFRMPLVDVVEARRRGGPAGTWLYDFRWESPMSDLAAHCFELPFVWDLLDADGVTAVLGARPPASLAADMHGTWVRFVTEGDPGWEPCSDARRPGMVFDAESAVSVDPYGLEGELRAVAG